MGNRKRYGLYLSPGEDVQLVNELDRCTEKGRKSELLRNCAQLGYQSALVLCAEIADQTALTHALAKLFASGDAPPDFRQAAEFMRAHKVLSGGRKAPVSAPVAPSPPPMEASPMAPPAIAQAGPSVDEVPEPPKAKPQWGNLKSLVGGQSRGEEQTGGK